MKPADTRDFWTRVLERLAEMQKAEAKAKAEPKKKPR